VLFYCEICGLELQRAEERQRKREIEEILKANKEGKND